MMRSIAYSRYFSTATPIQTGKTAIPKSKRSPVTGGPDPGESPKASGTTNRTIHNEAKKAAAPL